MEFKQAFEKLLIHEGGYSDRDPKDDPGGKTKYGVTESVARYHGYKGDMKSLPLAVAQEIYQKSYWAPLRADELPVQIRYAMFDCAVNSGVTQSAKFLQRAVGVKDDGIIGNKTILSTKELNADRLLKSIVSQRLVYMTFLKNWNANSAGWVRRLAKILEE